LGIFRSEPPAGLADDPFRSLKSTFPTLPVFSPSPRRYAFAEPLDPVLGLPVGLPAGFFSVIQYLPNTSFMIHFRISIAVQIFSQIASKMNHLPAEQKTGILPDFPL
jgi:hypothetical protein